MVTLDELRLQQLLGPFNRPQGIASLSQAASPLSFQYVDQLYPDSPPGLADEGYAIGPSGTADDLISTGFYGSPDIGFPFAPANRLQGLDLPRFQGVSELGRQDEDEEQVESLVEEEPSGIQKLLKTVMRFAVPGLSFLQNIAGGGQPYQQFSPGTTIRNGIVSVAGVNTPYSAFGGDFYNPNTGLNRFDRAAERFKQTGSMADLFASSRTGKEFFEKRRQIQAQKQKALEDAAKAKRQFKQDTGGGGGDREVSSGMSSALGGVYGGGPGGLHR